MIAAMKTATQAEKTYSKYNKILSLQKEFIKIRAFYITYGSLRQLPVDTILFLYEFL